MDDSNLGGSEKKRNKKKMNKKFKVILLVISFTISISMKSSEEIKWVDFNKGYDLAKKKKKIMLVDVYTDWCGWCKRMDRDAYAISSVSEVVNKDFIAVKFDPEIQGVVYNYEGKNYTGEQLAGVISNYTITGYPTTVFIYPKNKKSEVVIGYKNAEQLLPVLANYKKKFYGK